MKPFSFALIFVAAICTFLPLCAQENKTDVKQNSTKGRVTEGGARRKEQPAADAGGLKLEQPSADGAGLRTEQPAADAGGLKMEKPSADGAGLHPERPAADAGGLKMELPALDSVEGPGSLKVAPGSFSLGVAETHNLEAADEATVKRLQKEPSEAVLKAAKDAFAAKNFKLAEELYQMLTLRDPKNPIYFYSAGDAYYYGGDYPSAFADFVTAWHLGDSSNPQYAKAAEMTVDQLKAQVDDQFRLTYGYGSQDQETILNAATRLWKAGFTKQSIQLNEYALKNQPLLAQVAAYNLGAIAEHNRDYKQALAYYEWAGKRTRLLQAEANSDFRISKSLSLLPPTYIEQAISDTQYALKGNATVWRGWTQATQYPKYWNSEVCPLCAISRTQTTYQGGQASLEH